MWGLQEIVRMNHEAEQRARRQRAAARQQPAESSAPSRPNPPQADFVFKNPYDKVWVLEPQNERAKNYLREAFDGRTVFWSGGTAVVAHDEVDDLAQYLTSQGFDVV